MNLNVLSSSLHNKVQYYKIKKKLSLLLIEDDEIERMKFNRVCQKNNIKCTIKEANNGEKALDFLNDAQELPHLILVDLNMPKMNGIEFLKILKKDNRLKYIPTVVVTSSDNHEDIKKSYESGATGYLIKPLRVQDYESKIVALFNYWSNNELVQS